MRVAKTKSHSKATAAQTTARLKFLKKIGARKLKPEEQAKLLAEHSR
jgi:hypothetical protein